MIIFGSALTVTTSAPEETLAGGGYNVTPQAQALLAVPVIQRNRVRTEIVTLLVTRENRMNKRERAFWKRLLKMLDNAERRAEQMSRRRGR